MQSSWLHYQVEMLALVSRFNKIKVIGYMYIRIISVLLSLMFDVTVRAVNTFCTQIESDCRLNLHFHSQINGISWIRQSSLPRHFLRTENICARSVNTTPWSSFICLPMTEVIALPYFGEDGVWCNRYNPLCTITFETVNNALMID